MTRITSQQYAIQYAVHLGRNAVCEQHQQSLKKTKCLKTVFASRYETISSIGFAHFF